MLRVWRRTALAIATIVGGTVACAATPALSAELPKATQDFLKKLKLSPDILSGLDEELKVPDGWEAAAKKEGQVRILGTWDPKQFTIMNASFRERFPGIKVEYSRANFNARALRTLIAFKEGRYTTDILTGFGGSEEHYREAKALEDMRIIPGLKNPLPNTGGEDGTWVGTRIRYWCLTYNTDLVKKEDLPKTWEDLLTNKAWHNGAIGVGDRPQLWMLMLWGEKGKDWAVDYMDKFFKVVKPQLRKEGANALLGLTIAGEFKAALPAAAYRTKQYVDRGAPITWHCPEPVPLAVSQMGILKGNPHPNASRVWVNWFLSKEGQIAQYAADQAPPVHKDLQIESFLQFADQIQGRKIAYRVPEQEGATEELNQIWAKYWASGGGAKSESKGEE
jgi:iron(III) transport system substrate-binding protein